ncbi:hypothetical protein PR202_gb11616 [Eleusine coracana subsp. coracana]|uniref:SIAH-type domain-containing protein n=1 Tax=Eleusine coracana subsp. coracana TaxID=191504 RepID=A0AAV5EN50_ELECO|nr:hypothetical protein PR202_gb11616 [Eleusine coracana subsp. coracana]
MERVVDSVVAPCSFSKHGCVEEITCFNKKKHEKVCSYRPCFCQDSACSFSGAAGPFHHPPQVAIQGIQILQAVQPPVKPGPCLLHAQDDRLFLMNIEPLEPLGHAISLVCIQPDGRESRYGCLVDFSCFKGHSQTSSLEAVKSSSLLDGLRKEYFCIVPCASDRSSGVMLRTIIDTELVYDEVEDELEDEDDEDESYNEDEDDSSDDG